MRKNETHTLDPPTKRVDHGFFGPSSPTWKVWTSPTAHIGFLRAVVVESFDPFLAAAVHEQNGVRRDPNGRLNRTGAYFQTIACGDSKSAIEASEFLMKIHAKVVGTEPITGKPYNANDPDSQLWIHITGWHSVLYAYEKYGPGTLSHDEELQYWRECAIAAELQTCDPKDVPLSRGEVRNYYSAVRSKLCVSEHARALIHYFLYTPIPGLKILRVLDWIFARATIATLPIWMRELAGLPKSAVVDRMIQLIARFIFSILRSMPLKWRLKVVEEFVPSVRAIWEKAFSADAPLTPTITTPAQAHKLYGEMGWDSHKGL